MKSGYETVFDVCFDLHTGDRLSGFWERIDGSKDLYNLNIAALKHQLEIGEPEVRLRLTYSGQEKAIDRLHAGEIDLAFITGNTGESAAWAGQAPNGAEAEFSEEDYEYIPIARDALVVVCNEATYVKNLTIQRLQEIFIDPASLKLASGSYEPATLYLSDTATSEAITRQFPNGIENAQKVNDHMALYRTDRETDTMAFVLRSGEWRDKNFKKLKVIAVDGVLPTMAAIIGGTYPLSITCYAVLRKDLPDDHPARTLVNWLLSEDGQRIVRSTGYAPLTPLQ